MVRSSLNIPKREKGGSVSPAGSSVFGVRALVQVCARGMTTHLRATGGTGSKKKCHCPAEGLGLSPSMIPARFFRVSFVE